MLANVLLRTQGKNQLLAPTAAAHRDWRAGLDGCADQG